MIYNIVTLSVYYTHFSELSFLRNESSSGCRKSVFGFSEANLIFSTMVR